MTFFQIGLIHTLQTVPLVDWLQVVQTFGVVGVLAFNVWAFATGLFVPSKIVDQEVKSIENLHNQIIQVEMTKAIRAAVRDGVLDALHNPGLVSDIQDIFSKGNRQ